MFPFSCNMSFNQTSLKITPEEEQLFDVIFANKGRFKKEQLKVKKTET